MYNILKENDGTSIFLVLFSIFCSIAVSNACTTLIDWLLISDIRTQISAILRFRADRYASVLVANNINQIVNRKS